MVFSGPSTQAASLLSATGSSPGKPSKLSSQLLKGGKHMETHLTLHVSPSTDRTQQRVNVSPGEVFGGAPFRQ